jgi:hypothetical protein
MLQGARGDGSREFMGTPLAACHPDFIFFNIFSNKVPHTNKLNCLGFVKIRFRWQKRFRHGQFRTIKAMPNDPLWRVARAWPIHLWVDTLCVPPWTPVVIVHIPEIGTMKYVKRVTVDRFLKKAMVLAYPDQNHRIRHLEQCFMPHCPRISVCLALKSAGISREAIVHGGIMMQLISTYGYLVSWSPLSALLSCRAPTI